MYSLIDSVLGFYFLTPSRFPQPFIDSPLRVYSVCSHNRTQSCLVLSTILSMYGWVWLTKLEAEYHQGHSSSVNCCLCFFFVLTLQQVSLDILPTLPPWRTSVVPPPVTRVVNEWNGWYSNIMTKETVSQFTDSCLGEEPGWFVEWLSFTAASFNKRILRSIFRK